MKKIECIIPAKRLYDVEKALREWGVRGMTVSDVQGYGKEQTRPEAFLFLPKTKIELYCEDGDVESLIQVISGVCKTGQFGDGKIIVLDIFEAVRLRTGERGNVAV